MADPHASSEKSTDVELPVVDVDSMPIEHIEMSTEDDEPTFVEDPLWTAMASAIVGGGVVLAILGAVVTGIAANGAYEMIKTAIGKIVRTPGQRESSEIKSLIKLLVISECKRGGMRVPVFSALSVYRQEERVWADRPYLVRHVKSAQDASFRAEVWIPIGEGADQQPFARVQQAV